MNGTHEIIELTESYDFESKNRGKQQLGKAITKHSIEDDINKLFESIGQSERHIRDVLHKSAMKRPMRVGPSEASGIGISEATSLKQALRGLCISQASELAAAKKRMSRLSASPGVSEAGATKKLYKTVVIETCDSVQLVDEAKGKVMETSIAPERNSNVPEKASESRLVSVAQVSERRGQCSHKLNINVETELIKSSKRDFDASKQSLRTHNVAKKKIVPQITFATKGCSQHNEGAKNDQEYQTMKVFHKTPDSVLEKGHKELVIVSSSSSRNQGHVQPTSCKKKSVVLKADERSRSREKGDFSQSSKSSIGEYSSTTSYSEESYLSGSSRSGYRPHMSKDLRWEAINVVQKQQGILGMRHFKLLRKIGGGDIGTVYLSELIGTSCLFAVKVMDNEFLGSRKKMHRAQTEKEILEILDHPFLPTLYLHFMTRKYSCFVMEYCPGGDLHVLRQKQLNRSFTEKAARFYAAEVLLALEYLHMLGVVYRDLKPENILVREDGHIMLSDFDLSLRCTVNPTLLNSSSPISNPPKKTSSPCSNSTCIHPFCLQPSWQLSCFTKTRKLKTELAFQVIPLPQLVVEPITARSNSFVGTHEYLAPEIVKGEGHGSAVDWWTFGIFLYELLYGKTPFKGTSNDETISNVVSECLKFPECSTVSSHARDLIRRLLKKEPENRLGSVKGAAEIKQHSFFEGLNWALIRCETPPELPRCFSLGKIGPDTISKKSKLTLDFEDGRDEVEFEMF